MTNTLIHGTIENGFEPVLAAFSHLWSGIEVGAGLSVFVDGHKVVELWGGYQDVATSSLWQQDTLVNLYSASKGIVSLLIACLVSDERIDYSKPVADYWPEFGATGKSAITVAELLSHQAGLPFFDPTVTAAELENWPLMTHRLAAQKTLWAPGRHSGYHAITWGYLVGELISRTTGLSVGTYLKQRLATQLMADCYIGVPDDDHSRCAMLIGPNRLLNQPLRTDPGDESERESDEHLSQQPRKDATPSGSPFRIGAISDSLPPNPLPPNNDPILRPYKDISQPSWRRAEIPATNGHASATGLATCYAMASMGGTFAGEQLIKESVMSLACTEEVPERQDLCLNQRLRRSRGFILNSQDCYLGPEPKSFGHPGTGGTMAFADRINRLSFAYVTNQLQATGAPRSIALIDACYRCL